MKPSAQESLLEIKVQKLEERLTMAEVALAAYDSLGVYPKSWVDADGVLQSRTPEMEGYNDCLRQLGAVRTAAREWFQHLMPYQVKALQPLLLDHVLEFYQEGEEINTYINVNDIFGPGADAEDVLPKEFDVLNKMYTQFGNDGVIAWVAHKRMAKPWRKNKQYPRLEEALAHMTKLI